MHGEADAAGDLFDKRRGEVISGGLAEDAGNAATPLLDKIEFSKDAGDDRIAELGDALFDVFDGKPRKKQAGAFDLDAVVEKGDPCGRAAAGIVGVNQRVDENFAEDFNWNAPDVFAPDFREVGSAHGVFFQKNQDFLDGFGQGDIDVDVVENVTLILTNEATALNPCVIEMLAAIKAVEKDAALAWNQTALIQNEEAEALKHPFINRTPPLEIACDGFEIEAVDGESGHGQRIKAYAGDTALEFSDELGIGLAIAGAKADVGALLHANGL